MSDYRTRPVAMDEARRQFLLGAVGVRLWYARAPLPGAAPSPEFHFPEESNASMEAHAVESMPSQQTSVEASREGLARLQGLLSSAVGEPSASRESGHGAAPRAEASPQPEAEPVPEAEAEVKGGTDVSSAPSVRFHWRFWVGSEWALVSSRSETAGRALEDSLARNILRALGDEVVRQEEVYWPVFANLAVPGNDLEGAVEVLSAVAEELKMPRQLWLGLESGGGGDPVDDAWPRALMPLGKATLSYPLGLSALAGDPGGKRELWRALQAVMRAS